MKAYLLSYNPVMPTQAVHNILDRTNAVETWISPYESAVIVLSRLTTNELSAVLNSHFGGIWYVLVEANSNNINGWLPNQFWEYISDPNKAWNTKVFAKLFEDRPKESPLRLFGKDQN